MCEMKLGLSCERQSCSIVAPKSIALWHAGFMARTVNVGARFFGGRPSLAELRKLNVAGKQAFHSSFQRRSVHVPGPDEMGGEKKARATRCNAVPVHLAR